MQAECQQTIFRIDYKSSPPLVPIHLYVTKLFRTDDWSTLCLWPNNNGEPDAIDTVSTVHQ